MRPFLDEDHNQFVLSLPAGDVAGVAAGRELEPDGYFWEGVARQLVSSHRPELAGKFTYDSDAEAFAAESGDREALAALQDLLVEAIDNPDQLRRLVSRSVVAEFID